VGVDFEKARWDAASLLFSGAVWLLSVYGSHQLFGSVQFGPASVVLSVPAGLRLILLLVFRGCGALGVALAEFLLVVVEGRHMAAVDLVFHSAFTGLAPYLALRLMMAMFGIGENLTSIRSIHLPFLALASSLGSALLLSLEAAAVGRVSSGHLMGKMAAMLWGNFMGILCVFFLTYLLHTGWRMVNDAR
jgi:hypothetical protein